MKSGRTAMAAFLLAAVLAACACGGATPPTDGSFDASGSSASSADGESGTDGFSQTGGEHSSGPETSSSVEASSSDPSASESSGPARQGFLTFYSNGPFGGEEFALSQTLPLGAPVDTGDAEKGVVKLNEAEERKKVLSKRNASSPPVYRFSGWAYDRAGERPFGGALLDDETSLYAVWIRSESYVKLSLFWENEPFDAYYLLKGAAFAQAYADRLEEVFAGRCLDGGLRLNGFCTADGKPFDVGRKVEGDTELFPCLVPFDGQK